MYIDDLDALAVDQSAWIAALDVSTNAVKGLLYITNKTDPDAGSTWSVTVAADETGYWTVTLDNIGGVLPTDEDEIFLTFAPAGDVGDEGDEGPTGPRGNTWYTGSGGPTGANLPADSQVGDLYLDTANGDVYLLGA
jgi:hypothetical protein